MMQQTVEDRAGGRDIAEQFAPFFDRAIGRHDGGSVLVTAHDDFQRISPVLGQDLSPISSIMSGSGLRYRRSRRLLNDLRFLDHEFAHQIEDGAVEHQEAGGWPRGRWLGRDEFCRRREGRRTARPDAEQQSVRSLVHRSERDWYWD